MELNHLRTFIAIAEEKNVTRAAKRLFMTPPAVSAQLKSLEEELGVELFVRTSKGMNISEKGKVLQEKARATLQSAQDMVNFASTLHENLIGKVTISLNSNPACLRVDEWVYNVKCEYPGIELDLKQVNSGCAVERLREGSLDLAFIFGKYNNKDLILNELADRSLVIAVPNNYGEIVTTGSWEELAQVPWIGSGIYCPLEFIIERKFEELSLPYLITVSASDDKTKMELVKNGLGAALLEKADVMEDCKRNYMVFEKDILKTELYLAEAKGGNKSSLAAAVKKVICGLWDVHFDSVQ